MNAPRLLRRFLGEDELIEETHRKLPVKSETPGLRTVSARKFAPLETSFLFKSQPYTPPGVTGVEARDEGRTGVDVERYRVPVTISRSYACCSLRNEKLRLVRGIILERARRRT